MSIQPTGSDAAGASGLGSQPMTVTPAAVEKVQEFASQNEEFAGKSFRVFVEGGGCSGFRYAFVFDDKGEGDTAWELNGVNIVVSSFNV